MARLPARMTGKPRAKVTFQSRREPRGQVGGLKRREQRKHAFEPTFIDKTCKDGLFFNYIPESRKSACLSTFLGKSEKCEASIDLMFGPLRAQSGPPRAHGDDFCLRFSSAIVVLSGQDPSGTRETRTFKNRAVARKRRASWPE